MAVMLEGYANLIGTHSTSDMFVSPFLRIRGFANLWFASSWAVALRMQGVCSPKNLGSRPLCQQRHRQARLCRGRATRIRLTGI
jgi:hypothetical protein